MKNTKYRNKDQNGINVSIISTVLLVHLYISTFYLAIRINLISLHASKTLTRHLKNCHKIMQEQLICTALWPLTVHTSACAFTCVAVDAISTVASILTRRNLLWPHCTFINIFLTVFPRVACTTATHWSLQYHQRLSFCSCLQTLVPVRELATLISVTGT